MHHIIYLIMYTSYLLSSKLKFARKGEENKFASND